jgi:hypothetical protein
VKKTIIASTLAALLTTAALPAVMAQDANAGASVDAGADVSVETPAVDAGTGTDAGATANATTGTDTGASVDASGNMAADAMASDDMANDTYGSAIASIGTSRDVDFSRFTDQAQVSIVTVTSLQGDADVEGAALDTEMASNADAMATLHSDIEGNSAVMAALDAEGYAASDVIGVKTQADGTLIVYVDDRS